MAVIAALLTGTVLLFLGGPDTESARSITRLWNNGHILYFALLSGFALQQPVLRNRSAGCQWLLVLGMALLGGTTIEVTQHFTGRSAQFGDLLRDLSGSMLVLAFSAASRIYLRRGLRLSLQLAALLFCLYLLLPLATSLVDEATARRQFPVLADFETPFELERWGQRPDLSITPSPSGHTGHSLLLPLTTARYSGAGLRHFPGDWRGYNRLLIDFYNPDSTVLRLTCRVHDRGHERGNSAYADRYNRNFRLQPGWNTLTIDLQEVAAAPATRTLDLSRVRGFGCHSSSLPEPRLLYLDNVRLSR